jgi:hypothetical protein
MIWSSTSAASPASPASLHAQAQLQHPEHA